MQIPLIFSIQGNSLHTSVKQYLQSKRTENKCTYPHGKNTQGRKLFWDMWTHLFSTEYMWYVLLWGYQSSVIQVLFPQFQPVCLIHNKRHSYIPALAFDGTFFFFF